MTLAPINSLGADGSFVIFLFGALRIRNKKKHIKNKAMRSETVFRDEAQIWGRLQIKSPERLRLWRCRLTYACIATLNYTKICKRSSHFVSCIKINTSPESGIVTYFIIFHRK